MSLLALGSGPEVSGPRRVFIGIITSPGIRDELERGAGTGGDKGLPRSAGGNKRRAAPSPKTNGRLCAPLNACPMAAGRHSHTPASHTAGSPQSALPERNPGCRRRTDTANALQSPPAVAPIQHSFHDRTDAPKDTSLALLQPLVSSPPPRGAQYFARARAAKRTSPCHAMPVSPRNSCWPRDGRSRHYCTRCLLPFYPSTAPSTRDPPPFGRQWRAAPATDISRAAKNAIECSLSAARKGSAGGGYTPTSRPRQHPPDNRREGL